MSGEIYAFHKMFPHGEDVTVTIHENAEGYDVRSYAVAHGSEPSNTVDGITHNLDEAIKIAENECKWWDEWIESYWETKPLT